MSERFWFKIGEAAALAGVSPKDIRYWEKLIPELKPRRSLGNLRYYHRDDIPKLQAIHGWIQHGFPVADCRELLLRGCVTRDLGLDFQGQGAGEPPPDAPNPEPRPVSGAVAKPVPPLPGNPADEAAESAADPPRTDRRPRLREITASLRDLLERLRRPVV